MHKYSESELRFERGFNYEILAPAIYAAFVLAMEARRDEDQLTQAELARRMGKDKTRVSKLLSEYRNWTVRTISDLCTALDVTFEFGLVDNCYPLRLFTGTGVEPFGTVETINTVAIQPAYGEGSGIATTAPAQFSATTGLIGGYTIEGGMQGEVQSIGDFFGHGDSQAVPNAPDQFLIAGTSHGRE